MSAVSLQNHLWRYLWRSRTVSVVKVAFFSYPVLMTSKIVCPDSVVSDSVEQRFPESGLRWEAGWSPSATMSQDAWGRAHTLRAQPGLGYTLQSVLEDWGTTELNTAGNGRNDTGFRYRSKWTRVRRVALLKDVIAELYNHVQLLWSISQIVNTQLAKYCLDIHKHTDFLYEG